MIKYEYNISNVIMLKIIRFISCSNSFSSILLVSLNLSFQIEVPEPDEGGGKKIL